MNNVLLLADLESFVGGLFMVVVFIGWILNLAGQNKPPAKPVNRRPPAPGGAPAKPAGTIQNEIERFLEQARKANQPPGQKDERKEVPGPFQSEGVEVIQRPLAPAVRRAPPPEPRARTQREIWEEQIGKRDGNAPRPPQVRPEQKRPAPSPRIEPAKRPRPVITPPRQPTSTSPAPRPGESIAERHIPRQVSTVGTDRNPNGIAQTPINDVRSQMTSNVNAHLGTFSAKNHNTSGGDGISQTITRAETPAVQLAQLMRSRKGVREAILLSEIMARPRALR